MGVVKRTRKPWPHICEDCGTEFLSAGNAVRCPECRKKHKAEYDKARRQQPGQKEKEREAARAYYQRNREKCNERGRTYKREHKVRLNANQRAYYRQNIEKERARKREYSSRYYKTHKESFIKKTTLRQKAKRGNQQAQLELAKLTGKALFCERMRVTALNLPCGKREECWCGKPCPRTVELGLTPPRGHEKFDFGCW